MNEVTDGVVGVVGLGTMGGRVAGHLSDSGFSVVGFDPSGTIDLPSGVIRCPDIETVASRATVVVLSVPDGEVVLSCVRALSAAEPRTVEAVIDISTIGVAASRQADSILAQAGIGFIDSPVSGSLVAAASGALSLMVSGPPELLAKVKGLLDRIGTVSVLGESAGLGQAMKLINNAISGTTLAVTSESLALGCELGLDLRAMIDVINRSSGRSLASEVKIPEQVLTGAYAHGGPGSHFAKDIWLYVAAAREAGIEPGLTEHSATLWAKFAAEWPGADQTEIFPYLLGQDRPREDGLTE